MPTDLLLKQAILLKEFRGIQPFTIDFKNRLTVIVGENGCGKSSFFTLLTDSSYHKDMIKVDTVPGLKFVFFDTEKHNPRIKHQFGKNAMYEALSRFHSHGEAMLPIIRAAKDFNDKLILIDEPEAGISLKNQKKILTVFRETVRKNCQIIIITHSYFLIKNVKEVFDMETKTWMTSKAYLQSIEGTC